MNTIPPTSFTETTPLPSKTPPGCVLLVDDESTIRSAGSSVLQYLGYSVETAENGRQGLEMIEARAGQYQLILLDLAMPVLDGSTALKIIRAKYPSLPVLLMSGYLSDKLDVLVQLGGPTAVIQKPFSLLALQEGVAGLLGR
jgi:two-component system cell cycle sensor histidine kinase/response regulator CckA